MDSVQQHHPDWDRFVLLVGGDAAAVTETSFTTVALEALRLPHVRQFCFRYSILELNTAVKPWMFEHLFARGYDRVVYFDPDIVVYSPLTELEAAAPETFITVTPHLTGFIKGDDHPSERSILQAGTYNLGFLAVSRQPELTRFLAWWQEKLEFQCVVDIANGLFVDQKWIDLVPGLFPNVSILRHEGYNVAYWNLGQRSVSAQTVPPTSNGVPIRFYHFSGFDPAMPDMVSKHDSRLRLIDVGGAAALLKGYCAALRSAGYESSRSAPYAFGFFTDGSPVPNAARVAYRNSASLQKAAGADPFQHPELFAGIRDPRRPGRLRKKAGLVSYRLLSSARPLVRLIPPALRVTMREVLLGRKESPAKTFHTEASLSPGLNIVGYATRDTGVGESARLCQRSCAAADLENQIIDVDAPDGIAQRSVYRTSIYHVNADQTPVVHEELRSLFDASSYNIGCWHWELPELPDAWVASADPLDEIWAPSAFVQSAVSRKVTIPVVHMPHGVAVTDIAPCSPEELGVPRGLFTFLFMFDLDSVVQRKNPLAAVEAFRRAFPDASSTALLIKAGRADRNRVDYAELEQRLRGIPGVYLSDRMLPRARVNGLLAACDSVVSLHRSEGFGLILAEAMDLGKPVIATGWSGNMDFMNSGNSCPVGYELVTLDRTYRAYDAGQQWAEPDVEHAAHLMKRVAEDAEFRKQIGEKAQQTIRSQFSPEAAGLRYRRRLAFLGLLNRIEN